MGPIFLSHDEAKGEVKEVVKNDLKTNSERQSRKMVQGEVVKFDPGILSRLINQSESQRDRKPTDKAKVQRAAMVRLGRETYIKQQTLGTNGHSEMVSGGEQTQEMEFKGQDTSEEGEEDPTAPYDYSIKEVVKEAEKETANGPPWKNYGSTQRR